jgi:dinuclear metal center YbgI/SA1388 family protein
MPAPTAEILAEADRLLDPRRFEDYCVNGLQVPGPDQVRTIASGVSAHAALFELAAAEHAELLLVHHGLIWGSGVRAIDPLLKHRLELLFDAGIALAAYHLPLDAHPELGNNALLARALGADGELTPFALIHGQAIGFIATLAGDDAGIRPGQGDSGSPAGDSDDAGLPAQELFARVESVTERRPLVFDAGPPRVRRLAIVSGGGTDFVVDAAAAGADGLLTGEPTERSMALARESRVHLINAGHHATETFGVKALGEHLAERFGLRHVFLDVPNPV